MRYLRAILTILALAIAGTAGAQLPPSGEKLDVDWLGDPAAMFRARDYGGVIYPAQTYLKQHPDSWGARWILAGAYFYLGTANKDAYTQALEAFDIVLKKMPQRPALLSAVHYWRGRSYLAREDYAAAHEAFTASFAAGDLRHVSEYYPHFEAGRAALSANAADAAVPLFDAYVASTTNPLNRGLGLLWKSRALRQLKQGPAALAAIEASVVQYLTFKRPLEVPVLVQRAECLADAGDRKQALQDLDAALKRSPIGDEEKRLLERAKTLRTQLLLPPGYVFQGGLTWMPSTAMDTWPNTAAWCSKTAINGQTGWRMPTKPELLALHASGALNGQQGWRMIPAWSTEPHYQGKHEVVSLGTGDIGWFDDGELALVTCVR